MKTCHFLFLLVAATALAGCSPEPVTPTAARVATPAPSIPPLTDLPVTVTVQQRSTTVVPGSDERIRLTIDDITQGQVMASLALQDGRTLIGPLSMRPGDSSRFTFGEREYVLTLTELSNALVGDDFATFELSEAAAKNAAPLTEDEKIERLIAVVAEMEGATFLRNGAEYPAQEAADHLRMKRRIAGERIMTAEEFIEGVASRSSQSGEAYRIRMADGSMVEAGEYLRERLREIERGNEQETVR